MLLSLDSADFIYTNSTDTFRCHLCSNGITGVPLTLRPSPFHQIASACGRSWGNSSCRRPSRRGLSPCVDTSRLSWSFPLRGSSSCTSRLRSKTRRRGCTLRCSFCAFEWTWSSSRSECSASHKLLLWEVWQLETRSGGRGSGGRRKIRWLSTILCHQWWGWVRGGVPFQRESSIQFCY